MPTAVGLRYVQQSGASAAVSTQEKDLTCKQQKVPDYRKNYALLCAVVQRASTSLTRLTKSSVTKIVFKVLVFNSG